MLPRNRRINKEIIENVLKTGKSKQSSYFSVKYMASGTEKSRFTFVVSSGVAKKAVDRNFLKRRCRYVIGKNLGKIKDGFILMFFAKKGAESLTFKEIETEILSLLNNVGVIG